MPGRFVYFDLETSGTKDQEIIQIGAVGSRNDEPEFNKYLIPFGPISSFTTENIHGIYEEYGTLYKDGEPLDNVDDWETGIDEFFDWLQDEFPSGAILVSHNGFNCDARHIVRDFQAAGYSDEQIEDTVIGFVDTIVAFNKTFRGLPGYSLKKLMDYYDVEEDVEHDALEDSLNLRAVVREARPHGCSFGWYNDFLMSGYKPVDHFL